MKNYTKPEIKVTVLNQTDVVTLSNVGSQTALKIKKITATDIDF